jgi:LmbE family N-acetylglucosaminyl deacetylase
MGEKDLRLLILGAHPDDAEYHAGGLAALYRKNGHAVRMISVTDGSAGHHQRSSAELKGLRRREAAAAGQVIGAAYETWDFPDGQLQAALPLRQRIIREIRIFAPDLVLTHRTNDYHPDHRAVGQAVQDASYMVTVPLVVHDVAFLRAEPVVAYMPDLFTRPCPLRPDIVLDIGPVAATVVQMLACHQSQVFEFLPFNHGITDRVPAGAEQRRAWLADWFEQRIGARADRFRDELIATYGRQRGQAVRLAEAFEVSEYAAPLTAEARRRLFGFLYDNDTGGPSPRGLADL